MAQPGSIPPLPLAAAALSETSHKRAINEDTVFQHSQRLLNGHYAGLYVVCDGIGGHREGQLASRTAVEIIVDRLLPVLQSGPIARKEIGQALPVHKWTEAAVRAANNHVHFLNQPASVQARTGSTVTLALVVDETAHIAQVGDSRAYAWQEGAWQQITVDHSWAADLAESGVISRDEIVDHPRSNVLSRALGQKEEVQADLFDWPLFAGDLLLLCSDGLWKVFPRPEQLPRPPLGRVDPAAFCQVLVAEAARRDASDDISAVLVAVG